MTDHSLPPWPDDSWGRWRRFRSMAGRDVWVRPRHMAEEHPSIEHFSEREAVHLFEGWAFDEGAYWDLLALYEAEWGPPAEQRERVLEAFADEGLRLFRFLADQLGRRHEAMVINIGGLGAGDSAKGVGEVWNHALFHCTTDFLEREDAARPSLEDPGADGDDPTGNVLMDHPLGMDLEVRLAFNKDAAPPTRGPTPAVVKPYGVELEAHDALSFALRVEYDGRGVPRDPDSEHFVEAWSTRAPGRWLPRSLMTLLRPVSTLDAEQTAKEEHEREYNPAVRGDLTRLLRLRAKYQ